MTYTGRLRPEHLAFVEQVRDEWMAAGLSTDRADRPAAEAAVRAAYRAAGLAEPELVVWMDSPFGGMVADSVLSARRLGDKQQDLLGTPRGGRLWGQLQHELRTQLRDPLGDQLQDQLGGHLRDHLWTRLQDQLQRPMRDHLWDQLGGDLRGQLGGRLWGKLADQLWRQLGRQLRVQLGELLLDQRQFANQMYRSISLWWDSYWLALYTAALFAAGLPASERLDRLADATRAVGWWWPHDRGVILTDRPTAIHRDAQGRLHAETGPALAYADGYALHAWHGVRVPADLVDGAGWDCRRILREPNVEVRRCAIERMGWGQFAHAAGLRQVGESCPDPGNPGHELSLWHVPERIYGDDDVRVLLCTNGTVERDGTRRQYGLIVPATISEPLAAAAWTYDDPDHPVRMPPSLYARIERRT